MVLPGAQATARPAPRDVRFGTGSGVTGQVDTPGTEGPYPLMVLIPGGSLSRRGTSSQFPAMSRLYDPLVDAALREGWAVFRYDRHETPPGSRDESQDIIDAIRAARALPDVDTRRIVLCAHASGTVFLQQAYDRVEEIIGFRALRGVVLLSNRADASEAGRMAGHLLVVVGESASTDENRAGENAFRTHRESYPQWNARYLMVPNADVALCDTTTSGWRGWQGLPGSCRFSPEISRAISELLRAASAATF